MMSMLSMLLQQKKGGLNMNNKDIRNLAIKHNVKLWQIAHELGMSDSYFSKKLRFELKESDKERIKQIIFKLSQ